MITNSKPIYLQDDTGELVLPITSTKQVYDVVDGRYLDAVLAEMKSQINSLLALPNADGVSY